LSVYFDIKVYQELDLVGKTHIEYAFNLHLF
jgi:hypothetical protein